MKVADLLETYVGEVDVYDSNSTSTDPDFVCRGSSAIVSYISTKDVISWKSIASPIRDGIAIYCELTSTTTDESTDTETENTEE